MKNLIQFLFLIISSINAYSQTPNYSEPEYIGGDSAYREYLKKNLNYPATLYERGISGEVKTVIDINSEGRITYVNAEGENELLNETVKKTLLNIPAWKPAFLSGLAIDTSIVKEFYFSIDTPRAIDSSIYECMVYKVPITSSKNPRLNQMFQANDLYKKGVIEIENKNYSLAIDYFNQSEKLLNKDNNLYFNRGIAYYESMDIESACKDWKKCAVKFGDKEAQDLVNKKCKSTSK